MSILATTDTVVVPETAPPRLRVVAEPEPWLEELVARHGAWLRQVVRRRMADLALVDDALQETLLRVCRSSPPSDDREVRRWLAVVARRACADVWRAQPPVAAALDEHVPAPRALIPGSDEHVAGLARRARIDDTLVRLPPRHRRLLQKQAVLGMSCEEIADDEDVSVACVTSALSRARAGFRRRYGDRDAVEVPVWLVPLQRVADRVRARWDALVGSHVVEWAAASVTLGVAAMIVVAPASRSADVGTVAAAAERADSAVPPAPIERADAPPPQGLAATAEPAREAGGSEHRPYPSPARRPTDPPASPSVGDVHAEAPRVDLSPEQWTLRYSIDVGMPGGAGYVRSEATFDCEGGRVGEAVCPLAADLPGAQSSR